MSPVDGVRSPKKNKTKNNTVKIKKTDPEIKSYPIKKTSFNLQDEHKYKLVWLLSIGIVVVIFISWLALFEGSEISTNNDNSILTRISNNFNNLWDSLIEDISQLNNEMPIENTNEAEQQLKELQEKVFPEFIESN